MRFQITKAYKCVLPILVTGLLIGCATGTQVTQQQYDSFEEGRTTQNEVIQTVGQPKQHTDGSFGSVLVYSHFSNDKRAYIPIVGPFLTRGVKAKTCTFSFDPNERLKNKSCSSGQYGGGPLSNR